MTVFFTIIVLSFNPPIRTPQCLPHTGELWARLRGTNAKEGSHHLTAHRPHPDPKLGPFPSGHQVGVARPCGPRAPRPAGGASVARALGGRGPWAPGRRALGPCPRCGHPGKQRLGPRPQSIPLKGAPRTAVPHLSNHMSRQAPMSA